MADWQPLDLTTDPHEPWPGTADPGGMVDSLDYFLAAIQRPAWHVEAACRGQGTERWFPMRGQSTRPAVTVCHTCPVQAQCLRVGIGENHGVWGGSSERGRRQLRRSTVVEPAA